MYARPRPITFTRDYDELTPILNVGFSLKLTYRNTLWYKFAFQQTKSVRRFLGVVVTFMNILEAG
jgi:hypothetical protein